VAGQVGTAKTCVSARSSPCCATLRDGSDHQGDDCCVNLKKKINILNSIFYACVEIYIYM